MHQPSLRSTPTANPGLQLRIAEFETLAEGLDYAARGATGANFFSGRGALTDVLTYAELRDRAIEAALRLSASGLARGSRVAVMGETSRDFLIFFYGCQYAGLIPVPLPLSNNLGGHAAYLVRLRGMLAAAGVSAAVASPDTIEAVREAAQGLDIRMVGSPDDFHALPAEGGEIRPLEKDEPGYIQYSSGSTSMPRGVLVSQRAVTSNVRGIAKHGLVLRPEDRCVSWLPLYHDMGLVGFSITPLFGQYSADFLPTSAFTKRPLLWLKLMSEQGATISFGPTLGYELCVRRAAKASQAFELSKWRIAGVGAEMIRADVLEQFAERFAADGFDRRAFLPSYGLAEATLAVSFPPLGRGVKIDRIDREACEQDRRAIPAKANGHDGSDAFRSLVVCGAPLPDQAVAIRDDEGRDLPERAIGRIHIKGPSVMDGYFQDPESTRRAIGEDGWLDTGDLGYLTAGELVVTGRSKDLIICNGRNIWPHDLEWVLESLEELRTGGVAAFSVDDADDGERVVIVAECRLNEPEAQQRLINGILGTIRSTAGVDCEVVLVPTRSLTFTSSGKLSRAAVKADYTAGMLSRLNVRRPDGPPRAQEAAAARPAGE